VHRAPGLGALDQVRPRQHIEVLHHSGQRNRERCGNLGHRQLRLVRQAIDNRAPRRVGERREGEIEPGALKVNHVVKYHAARRRSQGGRIHVRVRSLRRRIRFRRTDRKRRRRPPAWTRSCTLEIVSRNRRRVRVRATIDTIA